MGPDLDTRATALYVTTDDLLVDHPEWAPERPTVGIVPKLSDAQLLTLAVSPSSVGIHIRSPVPALGEDTSETLVPVPAYPVGL